MRGQRYDVTYSFGPGPVTPAVKQLLIANGVMFLLQNIAPVIVAYLGLMPSLVVERFWVWQLVTYLFLHGGILHLLFNMLVLWMFGVDLERRWGYEAFLRYYFVCGVGAGLTTLAMSFFPADFAQDLYASRTIGASGAIYGVLLAFGMLFPQRIIYFFIFPVPARIYVIVTGLLVLWSAHNDPAGGTAHFAHLGGMLFGYVYLTRGRGGPMAELKYRYTKWRMARMRRRFGVHSGGRDGWGDRIH